jgi:hypothetical protein
MLIPRLSLEKVASTRHLLKPHNEKQMPKMPKIKEANHFIKRSGSDFRIP